MVEGIRYRNGKYSYRINYKNSDGKWKSIERGGFKTMKEAVNARKERLEEIGE